MTADPKRYYTPAEYYEREAKAEYKSDYYNGEIFPCGEVGPDGQLISMAGGSIRHSIICSNILQYLGARVRSGPCKVLESNARLRIPATGLRTYPDVSVYCGQRQHDPEDPAGQTLLNPTVLFEVLSPTTEAYDRGVKASHYRRIESLRLLVLLTQDSPHVELHVRGDDGKWLIEERDGIDALIEINSIEARLPLSEIYSDVDFTTDR
jgi:Uma2 family endonuclease